MLSDLVEYGRIASLQYFPGESGSLPILEPGEESGDQFAANLEYKEGFHQPNPGTTIRVMDLTVRQKVGSRIPIQESQTVRHYQFDDWDVYATQTRDEQQAFVELCKSTRIDEIKYSGTPRIVHSGEHGFDRTGTFIALDFLLGEIEDGTMEDVEAHTDLIFDTVDSLTKQRMQMVDSLKMYQFLYQILRNEISKKLETDARAAGDLLKSYPFYPAVASVIGTVSESNVSQFSLFCVMSAGGEYELKRSFKDFYDLSQSLSPLQRSGQAGRDRLPAMPWPGPYGLNWTASQQREWVDEYVKKLLILPLYCRQTSIFDALNTFFKPREGDIEVTVRSVSPKGASSARHAEAATPAPLPTEEEKKQIKFKDCLGRKFTFPFNLCNTWMVCTRCIPQHLYGFLLTTCPSGNGGFD